MFLRVFARITPSKLVLTAVLGLLCAAAPRIVCGDSAACSYCLPLVFQQFLPLVNSKCDSLMRALRVLEFLSGPVNRMLDTGHAYVLACLLLLPRELRKLRHAGNLRTPDRRTVSGTTLFAALVALYATQQIWLRTGAPAVYHLTRFRLDVPTLAYDTASLTASVWLSTSVATVEHSSPSRLSVLRKTLAVLLILAQTTGLPYRYAGLPLAPNDSFALLLGAAYVLAPFNLILALLTSYHTRPLLNRREMEQSPNNGHAAYKRVLSVCERLLTRRPGGRGGMVWL